MLLSIPLQARAKQYPDHPWLDSIERAIGSGAGPINGEFLAAAHPISCRSISAQKFIIFHRLMMSSNDFRVLEKVSDSRRIIPISDTRGPRHRFQLHLAAEKRKRKLALVA